MSRLLDLTLPADLQDAVRLPSPDRRLAASSPAASTQPQPHSPTETDMDSKDHKIDTAAVAAIVKDTVKDLDNAKAVASKVEELSTDKLRAEASAASLSSELDTLRREVDQRVAEEIEAAQAAKAEAATAMDRIKSLELEAEAMRKSLEASRAEAQGFKEQVEAARVQTIASERRAKLEKLGARVDPDLLEQAVANQDGEFRINDQAFELLLSVASRISEADEDPAADAAPQAPDLSDALEPGRVVASLSPSDASDDYTLI